MDALVHLVEESFAAVGEPAPSREFFARVVYAELFPGGMYLAYRDHDDPEILWLAWFHAPAPNARTLPLQKMRRFLALAGAVPGVRELHVHTHQSAQPEKTARILERFGFERVGRFHYAALPASH